jgi:hypothetical protein
MERSKHAGPINGPAVVRLGKPAGQSLYLPVAGRKFGDEYRKSAFGLCAAAHENIGGGEPGLRPGMN